VLPRYNGACNRGLIPALLAPGGPYLERWMPAECRGATRFVVLVIDGLGWDQLQERRHLAPVMAALPGASITTVAPSTTSTALTSIATGLTPGEHGVLGYRLDLSGDIVNMLRWSSPSKGDMRRLHPPATVQPFTPFLGEPAAVCSKIEFEQTAFTEAHMRGTRNFGWRVPSNLPVRVAALLDAGETFVYAYYDGIDKVAHEYGFGRYYDAELTYVDDLVADLLARLDDDTVVLITADHGQVHVGPEGVVTPHADILAGTRYQSGEGRFRWLHCKHGAAADVLAAAAAAHGETTWVASREQTIDEGWFGPSISAPNAKRLGDVALVPFAPISFDDPADTGGFPLVCRHGSLTSAEMYVPLLAARRSK
jgi:Type I phosphodiesterase / nucleotide pyrophosphatase